MERLFVALTALPFIADLLDRFVAWATKRYRQQIEEGDELPPFAFVLWVRVTHRNTDYDHDLWVVRLPFYRWDLIGWTNGDNDRYGWCQLSLFNRRPFQRRELSNGNGWKAIWLVH